MVVIQLPDDLHNYLQLVIQRYAKSGIDPEEGQALFFLNDFAVKRAQHIPDAELQAAARGQRKPTDDTTSGTNSGEPKRPTFLERTAGCTNGDELAATIRDMDEEDKAKPINDGVRTLQRGDVGA